MTSSAKSIKGSSAGIDYMIDEKKGYELDRNLLYGNTSKEILQSFKIQQELADVSCSKRFITGYISPDPKDGRKLSDAELKDICHDYMERFGIDTEKQAYLLQVHTEKEHKHVHFLINRIDENGLAIDDSYSVRRTHEIMHKIAQERELISSKNIMLEKQNNKLNFEKENKKNIIQAHENIMRMKPESVSKYQNYMKSFGYEVKAVFNKQGDIQGFRIIDREGKDLKMSEISRKMPSEVKKLKVDIEKGQKTQLKKIHSEVMNMKPQSIDKYQEYMRSFGYDIRIAKSKGGNIKRIFVNEAGKTGQNITKNFIQSISNIREKLTPEEIRKRIKEGKEQEVFIDRQTELSLIKEVKTIEKNNFNKDKSLENNI